VPATATLALLTLLTVYSGLLLQRLYRTVPGAVLYGDIGEAAAGPKVCTHAQRCLSLLHARVHAEHRGKAQRALTLPQCFGPKPLCLVLLQHSLVRYASSLVC
jgi:hypothetical protein